MNAKPRLIITGAGGFIGSHLTSYLLHRGDYNVTTLYHSKRKDFLALNEDYAVWIGDVTDRDSLSPLFRAMKPHCVVHLAGVLSSDETINDAINREGTRNVVELCNQCGSSIIYSSSILVYGGRDGVLHEDMSCNPSHPHPKSKLEAEIVCLEEMKKDAAVLRFTNTYGVGGNGVVNTFLQSVMRGDNLEIEGDGQQKLDLLYVDDLVRAISSAIDKIGTLGKEVINVASGSEVSVYELATKILAYSDNGCSILHSEARALESRNRKFDIQKAKQLLGWEASISLEQALHEMMNQN